MKTTSKINFVFFGTSRFAVIALESLKERGFIPDLIITTPDKPKGRKLVMASSPVKVWAEQNTIPFLQPAKLSLDFLLANKLQAISYKLFLVASYGKIIPKEILDICGRKILNIHPSLLPKLRGPSPIQSSILNENETGVTIIRLDKEIDHGPIIAQKKINVQNWPPNAENLEEILAKEGVCLLAEILPDWLEGKVKEISQDYGNATYTEKIKKNDGKIDLDGDPMGNYRKIQAFSGWPGTFFFAKKNGKDIRVIIKKAEFQNGKLKIITVVPEGKKEMSYLDFLKGL